MDILASKQSEIKKNETTKLYVDLVKYCNFGIKFVFINWYKVRLHRTTYEKVTQFSCSLSLLGSLRFKPKTGSGRNRQ
jgi:hypothetical protein